MNIAKKIFKVSAALFVFCFCSLLCLGLCFILYIWGNVVIGMFSGA
jgi:hypothetical protein